MANLVFPSEPLVNVRSAPEIPADQYSANVIGKVTTGMTGRCTNVRAATDSVGGPHWWLNVSFDRPGDEPLVGWVRDDVIMVGGDFTFNVEPVDPTLSANQGLWINTFVRPVLAWPKVTAAGSPSTPPTGLPSPTDGVPASPGKWASPVIGAVITQDFHESGSAKHLGIDLGGKPVGTPVVLPRGATVYPSICWKCGGAGHNGSVLEAGLTLNDPNVLNDAGWMYGFGNMVIARYALDDLPAQAIANLGEAGVSSAFVFVLIAHLNSLTKTSAYLQTSDAAVGELGQSGNANGPHVHLQVIMGDTPTPPLNYNNRVVNPHLIFSF